MSAPAEPIPFVIPTIDISPYLKDPTSADSVKVIDDVRTACTTTGFFSLKGHGISKELKERVFGAMKALFALPEDEKKRLKSPVLVTRGYELMRSQVLQEGTDADLKEGYYFGREVPAESETAQKWPKYHGPNIYPSSLPDSIVKEPTVEYWEKVTQLGDKIFEILAKTLSYGDHVFDEFLAGDTVCALRYLHYPPQPKSMSESKQLGAGAHTDFGAITILLQDDAGGLEVLDMNTGNFVPVAPDPDAFVVNIGDMLSRWTKDHFKSATHRVVNRTNGERYSAPLFFDGNLSAKLSPFDGSNPVGDQGLTVEEYLFKRLKETFISLRAPEGKK